MKGYARTQLKEIHFRFLGQIHRGSWRMDSERQVLPAEHDAITFNDDDSTMGDIEVLVAF